VYLPLIGKPLGFSEGERIKEEVSSPSIKFREIFTPLLKFIFHLHFLTASI